MSRLFALLFCVFLSHSARSAVQETKPTAESEAVQPIAEAKLRAAWKRLDEAGRREAAEWFSQEARSLPIFQNALITFAKGQLEKDPYDWPTPEPDPVFDPALHAPAQPIARIPVDPESKAYQREWERLVGFRHQRALRSAWKYDYARRTVERIGDYRDPERLFENGLRGFAPDLDLVEALTQMALDDGRHQAEHVAFGHTYANRSGQSFPGITLYDAWSSGHEIEMPDVECLGLLHTLLDDWKSFVAPVSRQKPLYRKIEGLYVPMHRGRSLQTALARTYLIAAPQLDDGYAGTEDFLNHQWELASSDPARLRDTLPDSQRWEKWMENGQKELRRKEDLRTAAVGRRQHLAYGEAQIRSVWERVLQGMGVLDAPDKAD